MVSANIFAFAVPFLPFMMVSATAMYRREETDITGFTQSPVEFLYPPARSGFNASTAAYDPCGGATVSSSRTSFPLSGGQISIQSLGVAANLDIMYVNQANPTAYHQFSTYTGTILDISPGDFCTTSPDFSALGYSSGTDVTLMLFYQLYGTEETYYYHCADISLVDNSDYTTPSYTCSNTSTIIYIGSVGDTANGQTVSVYAATATGTTSAATETVTVSSSSGLSAAAGGGIGAAVTLALLVGAFAAAVMTGFVRFSRRHHYRVRGTDNSSINSTIPLRSVP